MNDQRNDYDGRDPDHERPYGFMERELAFKLLASHALVDREFYEALHANPRQAAEQLHILLTDDDVTYITNIEWDKLEERDESIREALHLDQVTNSW